MVCRVTFIGNLVKEPEVRTGKSGKKFVTFLVATQDKARKEEPLYQNGIAYGHEASYMESYCHKGDTIYGLARLKANNYVKNDGTKVYGSQLDIIEVKKLRAPQKAIDNGTADNEGILSGLSDFGGVNPQFDDDLPF